MLRSSPLVLCFCFLCSSVWSDSLESSFEPLKIMTTQVIESSILKQKRRINIYLPPSYEDGKQSYPVLYLLDGGVKEDFLHIIGIASLAADYRNIREFIVIGIEGVDRYHDMTSPSDDPEDIRALPTHGGASKFRRFLLEELLPNMEQQYRLTNERVLIGESLAGLFVVETFLNQPNAFTGYISVSPSMWWNFQFLAKESSQLISKIKLDQKTQLYLSIANEGGDMRGGLDQLLAELKRQQPKFLQWTFEPMKHEQHGTIYHPAALAAIRKLFITDVLYQYH